MKRNNFSQRLVFIIATIIFLCCTVVKSSAQFNEAGKVGKFSFYMEIDRIFTSENNLLNNIYILQSKMSKDGSTVFVIGDDKSTNKPFKRALVMKSNGFGIEEIDFTTAILGEEVDKWPLKDYDISSDGKVVFLSFQNHIYRYQDGKYEFLFRQADIANDELNNLTQIECDAKGDNVYIRDFTTGIFSIVGEKAGGAQHVVKPDDVFGGSTKKATRFDGPMHITDGGEKILFFVNETYSETQGVQYVNQMHILNELSYFQISEGNYGPRISAISGDGKVIVYRDTDGTFIAQDENTGGNRVYIKYYTDAITQMDLSYDGSVLLYQDAYMVKTNGSEALQLFVDHNADNFCINDSGTIIGYHAMYGGDGGKQTGYNMGYINQVDKVEDAPVIVDISVSPTIESNETQSLVTVTIQISDPNGLDNIAFQNSLVDKDGMISTSLSLVDNGTYGDITAEDGIYSRNCWFNNSETIKIRAQATDKTGKSAIAIAAFTINPTSPEEPEEPEEPTVVNSDKMPKPYTLFYQATSKQLQIKFEKPQKDVNVCVFNTVGQLLYKGEYHNQESINYNLGCFNKGIYLVQFSMDNKMYTEKMIKY